MSTPEPAEYDFFISYTQSDRHWAEWIAWQLEAAGYRTIIQAWDFAAGKNFVLEMDGAIRGSKRTLAVLSAEYLCSGFAASEWAAAIAADATGVAGKLLPVRIADVAPTGLLGQISRVDVFDCDEETARDRLLQAASAQRLKPSSPPGFPGSGQPAPMFPAVLSPIWNVPARNNKFAGREQALEVFATAVAAGGQAVVTQAISGLGGIGKSQLAMEYAYRHASEYRVVWWIRAEAPASRKGDLEALARRLFADASDGIQPEDLLNRLRTWLAQNAGWLLIFDNLETPDDLGDMVPTIGSGQVIVTSRHRVWKNASNVVSLDVWSPDEASQYLIGRTNRKDADDATELVGDLGYLPLAVEQAAAYIDETQISIKRYRSLFRKSRASLLAKPGVNAKATVSSIWKVSLDSVEARSPDAVTLLQLMAFLPPDGFPRSELSRRVSGLPGEIAAVLSNDLALDSAVATLRSYSLIEATPSSVSVHRLVQAVVQDGLSDTRYRTFAAAAHQVQFGGIEAGDDRTTLGTPRRRKLALPRGIRILVVFGVVLVIVAPAIVLLRNWTSGPITVSFDIWQDLGRERGALNVVKLSHEYLAVVIYGTPTLDVRNINVDSVYLSDGTGSAVPAAMYHLKEGYDENNDGRDDLKLDYRLADLKGSANKLLAASTFRITGRLKENKSSRPIRGERSVAVIP